MSEIFGPNVTFTPDLEGVKAMYEQDRSLRLLGITITRVEQDLIEGEMTVTAEMCNGFNTAQGGILFTFADALFAGACNGRSETPTVASQVSIHFLSPGKLGAKLRGLARQTRTWGRNGITDVTIFDGERVVAEFRGMSRTTARLPTEK
ncbi:hydroxyphenylacetyl-CoA thioesterase PaaI [Corynebacterium mayonis]|uniref:hydroxyphenylacetyl-CoA thioesterase PaaI n=1 Tax=Corynebacterium mayonis TaxID=3062461 RepID=UPI003140A729